MKCPYRLVTIEVVTDLFDEYDSYGFKVSNGNRTETTQAFTQCYKSDCPFWSSSYATCERARKEVKI